MVISQTKSYFVAYSRVESYKGWELIVAYDPKTLSLDPEIVCNYLNSRAHPDDFRVELESKLQWYGFTWPEEWIKFTGVWMLKDTYDKRMAELVALYKEKRKQ